VDPELSPWIRWLSRVAGLAVSEEELGDILEECAGGRHGALWACRQLLSTVGRRRLRGTAREGRGEMLSNIWADVRYAIRTLCRNPGFAIAAIAPIALGIGINTGIFSILDAVALQPVPSPRPAELISVYQQFRGVKERRIRGSRSMFSMPEYQRYRDDARTLSGVMAYSRYWTVTLGGESPREIEGALVSCNYFDVLQLRPAIGTGFTSANCDAPDAPPAVVLTHDLWTRAFGADRDIVRKTIMLNGQTVAVAGVAPEGFDGIDIAKVSFFAPTSMQVVLRPEDNFHRDAHTSWLTIIGRRQDGATIAQVRAELDVIASRIDRQEPGRTTTLSVAPARSLSLPEARRDIFSMAAVVLAAFGLILLIACANVANLLLARAAGRSKEITVRLALGVTRGRLIRQLLTESMIIALAGAVAGSMLAQWSFHGLFALLISALPGKVPALRIDTSPNLNVLSFALVVTVVTGLVFGLVPALQASRLDLQALLNRDTAGSGRRSGGWLRGSLIGVQVAVCMMLLISASLLLRGLYAAETIEPGFEYRNVAVVSFDLRGPGYDAQRALAFQQRLMERVASLPGVEAVAQVSRTPLSPGRSQTMARLPGQDQWREIDVNTVSPEYFSLIGIPIVWGRTFAPAELDDRSRKVIVTEATARRYWPGQDSIGRTLVMALGPQEAVSLEVVGVARDAQVSRVAESDTSYMYLPAGPSTQRALKLLVRSRTDSATTASAIRGVARDLAPGLVVAVNPLEDNLSFWRTVSRLVAGLSGSLSLLALLLASMGVYGVVSYVVSRRLREVGIRMMLGASARDVQGMMLRQTLRPVAIGMMIGVAGAAGVSQILGSVLFGISPFDPIAFIAAPLFLLGVAAAAGLLPTRAAVRLDPMVSLRYE
jgi:predicted permease